MKHLPVLILLLAVCIYSFRTWKASRPIHVFASSPSGEPSLNPKFFDRYIKKPYLPALDQRLFTLVVVVLPDLACPPLLHEGPHWIAPKDTYPSDIYGTVVVIPESTSQESIDEMKAFLNLVDDDFRFFKGGDPIWMVARNGVFKLLYSRGQGCLWSQKGNQNPSDHRGFELKLRATIEEYFQH